MDIDFRSPDMERFRLALDEAARRVPHAARNTLNRTAFAARTEWIEKVRGTFTLRNTWTTRSIRVEKARGTSMLGLQSRLGSVAPYMATQEHGDVERKRGRHGVAIPTSVASGEGRGTRPRRRLVRRPNRLPNIRLGSRSGSSRRQRNAIAIRMAMASGQKFVFLELERTRGIFRLAGGKRRPRVDLVWDLTRPSVRIPATHTLERALQSVAPTLPRIARSALLEQLHRARGHVLNVPGWR